MRIIITGGTGLIGKALANALLADGHQVIVLSRNPDKATNTPYGLQLEKWDGNGWQRLDPRTMKPGPHQDTHVPMPSGYNGPFDN